MRNRNALLGVGAALLVGSLGEAAARDNPVWASVNGVDILFADVEIELMDQIRTQYHRQPPAEKIVQMRKQIVGDLIDNELLSVEAHKMNLGPFDAQVSERMTREKEAAGGPDAFGKMIERAGVTEAFFASHFRRNIAAEALRAKIDGDAKVSEKEVAAYYAENANAFVRGESVEVVILDFPILPQSTDREKAEATTAATNAARLWRENPALSSEDVASRTKGKIKRLGMIHRGMATEQVEAIAFGLPVSGVSDPFRTTFGIHVLRVQQRLPAKKLTLDEVRESIHKKMREEKSRERYERLMDDLRNRAVIVMGQ